MATNENITKNAWRLENADKFLAKLAASLEAMPPKSRSSKKQQEARRRKSK